MRDAQLIPCYSVADGNARDGYSRHGYLWWVAVSNHYPKVELPDGSFSVGGAGGRSIAVIPNPNVVVVHRINTDDPAKKVTLEQFGELLRRARCQETIGPRSFETGLSNLVERSTCLIDVAGHFLSIPSDDR